MIPRRIFFVFIFILAYTSLAQKPPAPVPSKAAIIQNARKAYYNLRTEGLLSYEAKMQPDWDRILGDARSSGELSPNRERALRGLHFVMTLDAEGNIKVAHSADITPEQACADEKDRQGCTDHVAQGFEQIFGGMEQAVQGFFQTWSVFMLNDPFPPGDNFQIEELPQAYRLTYKEGAADVVLTMSRDYQVTDLKVTSTEFTSTIAPQFTRTPRGYVLASYRGEFASGPGAAETANVKVTVTITYQDVQAMQLPSRLSVDSVYNGTPNKMEFNFSDFQAKKK